jgi:hypothetical protein
MAESEAAPTPAEWVEIWRGPRRAAQLLIRHFRDASLAARDHRGLGILVKPGDLAVMVKPAELETCTRTLTAMKKNFPDVFNPGKKGAE